MSQPAHLDVVVQRRVIQTLLRVQDEIGRCRHLDRP
jgi:hypothetical protein